MREGDHPNERLTGRAPTSDHRAEPDERRRVAVDLQGRLSNPPYNFGRAIRALSGVLARPQLGSSEPVSSQRQRRLKPTEVDALVVMYEAGSSVAAVAASCGINRETVLLHLQRRGVRRRADVRKLDDEDVRELARQYEAGDSMSSLSLKFAADPKTLRRELVAAGVTLRRPGRPTG